MRAFPPPITSRANAHVKALRAALSGDARRAGDVLGLEGEHLMQEAHRSGLAFEAVFVRQGSEAVAEREWAAGIRSAAWFVLSPDVFDSAASTPSPQGIMATWVIREPEPTVTDGAVLVLENLQDPGNLGTLIRSAEAFGSPRAMVTPGTANQWNPKVLRASAGSVFRMPVKRASLGQIAADLKGRGVKIFAAAREPQQEADAVAVSSSFGVDLGGRCAILIGNEGSGLSEEARRLADELVQIPCATESLNAAVAGSVLLYEAMRQRLTTAARSRRPPE